MSGTTLAIYRLPLATAARIGQVRVVLDRHRRVYVNGSKVVSVVESGTFRMLRLANGEEYYVKAQEYERLRPAPPAPLQE